MKKYIYSLLMFAFSISSFTSCSVEEGTEPGNDSKPVATLYQYKTALPYEPDNDIIVRVAANSATVEAYIFAETTESKTARLSSLGTEGYNDYVVSNGVKLDKISGNSMQDYIVTGLKGENSITVVAKNADQKCASEIKFTGIIWNDVTTGTYDFTLYGAAGKFVPSSLFGASVKTTLQVDSKNAKHFRLKDVFGKGYHLAFNMLDSKGSDDNGAFTFLSVAAQPTGKTYSSYGGISIRDVATWQNNNNFLDNGMYDGGYDMKFWLEYFVSAGYLCYGYNYFIADK